MGRSARQVKYYNGRFKGDKTNDTCNTLEHIIGLREERGSIDSLKHTIYNLSDDEVLQVRNTGEIDPSISKEKGTLTDAQTLGTAFMWYSGSCLLGDSVGLGKTVQIAALLNLARKQNIKQGLPFRYLYLTEKTIVDQAVDKLVKFTRKYVHQLTGNKKENEEWREEMWGGHEGGIVAPHSIANQQIFHSWLSDVFDVDEDEGYYYFDYLIVDESSIFGNTNTQAYKNATLLKRYCKNIIFLNATPFESNLNTFYAQLNFIDDKMLTTKTEFKKQFYKYGYNPFGNYQKHTGYKNADVFKKQIGYFYFYHTRRELGAEIKNTHYELMHLPMSEEQKELMDWTSMYGYVYDCPTLLKSELPFDETVVPKLEMLDNILDEYFDTGDQVLIFCTFKKAQQYLQGWLEDSGYSAEILNGNITNINERNRIVRSFVNKEYDVLITSVQKGLDFGDVKNLVFYSFESNPNKMIQMEGRLTRSFNIENKNIFILANEGKELNKFKKDIKKTLKSSHDFSSKDLSGVVELLLNIMD